MALSEHILVLRLRRGDRDACSELIRRFHAGVYGYLRRLGADAALAEDLTQETYTVAWQRIGSLRKVGSLRAWLLTIARNAYFQFVRAEGPERTGLDDEASGWASRQNLEGDLDRAERDRGLRRAVARLEPSLQEAVALHYFQDLSYREVGTVLGVPAGTAKSRVHRALERLRALLDHEEADHEEQRAEEALARDS